MISSSIQKTSRNDVKHVKNSVRYIKEGKPHLSENKMHLLGKELKVLGRIVDDDGIRMNPDKGDSLIGYYPCMK